MNNGKKDAGALKEGRQAATAGEPTSTNPFPVGGSAHDAWLAGWKGAKDQEGNTAGRHVMDVDHEQAFEEGKLAATRGEPISINPYSAADTLHDAWVTGWSENQADLGEGILGIG